MFCPDPRLLPGSGAGGARPVHVRPREGRGHPAPPAGCLGEDPPGRGTTSFELCSYVLLLYIQGWEVMKYKYFVSVRCRCFWYQYFTPLFIFRLIHLFVICIRGMIIIIVIALLFPPWCHTENTIGAFIISWFPLKKRDQWQLSSRRFPIILQ